MNDFKVIRNICDEKDITPSNESLYRYIDGNGGTAELQELFDECLAECRRVIYPRACYMSLPVSIDDIHIDFTVFDVYSKALADNLAGSEKCVLMGATIGIGIDRIISKYSSLSPVKAWICQSIGAEYIENYCDILCTDFENRFNCYTKMRFSPGYGDLTLSEQTKVFQTLDLSKHCGISLTDSCIMRPSKSVTAFCGLSNEKCHDYHKCELCCKNNCPFRKK